MTIRDIESVQTPALLLDRGKFEHNLERMRTQMARWPGVQLRPHLKTAKSLAVADRVSPQRGPVTVSTLREAEEFAKHGFTDIIYAVGIAPDKLARVAALNRGVTQVAIILDNAAAAERVAAFATAQGVRTPTLIEVDTDGHRGGVRPGDPVVVAIGDILARAGVLRGVLTHAGGSYGARSEGEITAFAAEERDGALQAAEQLRAAGLPSPVVSIGSTPTALFTKDLSGITEVRAGVYMFQDLVMAGLGVCRPDEIALSVLTSVIGHQSERGQLIVDAGWMALSRDRGTQRQALDCGFGLVCDVEGHILDDLQVTQTNQEHGVVARRSQVPVDLDRFPIGSRLRILPNHACATAAQHGQYEVVAGGQVVDEWARFGHW
jgi:D-serine deaminase-like pyridoxal phosphate-dependent protein